MDFAANPLGVLTFISAPAVLTNASCVLLFGAGNRYGRAVDRMHELSELVDKLEDLDSPEAQLRLTQLEAAENRALYIVRALTCFYSSAAAFAGSTLIGLLSGIGAAMWADFPTRPFFGVGLVVGSLGVAAIITGAALLVSETRTSFEVLRQEKQVISARLGQRRVKAK